MPELAPDLRFSKSEASQIATLASAFQASDRPAALGYRLGAPLALQALALRAASFEREVDPADIASVQRGARQTFPVRAQDLMPQLQGAALGERLRALEATWIASDFTHKKDDLLGGDISGKGA